MIGISDQELDVVASIFTVTVFVFVERVEFGDTEAEDLISRGMRWASSNEPAANENMVAANTIDGKSMMVKVVGFVWVCLNWRRMDASLLENCLLMCLLEMLRGSDQMKGASVCVFIGKQLISSLCCGSYIVFAKKCLFALAALR